MWQRCVLLLCVLCVLGIGSAADSLAQVAPASGDDDPSPIIVPNSAVHHVTSAGGRTYTLYVQLPESYAASDSLVYPVLYLTDAEVELLGTFTGLTYFLRLTNNIRDVILVGVADGGIPEHFGVRSLDYTPTESATANFPSGGAPAFLAFLRDRAMPFIEDRYRADPADRGIWGHSLGGLFGAWALLESPGTFHRYLLSSPSFNWDDRLLVKHAASYGAAHDRLPGRVYSAFGAEEPASAIEAWSAFFAELTTPGYPDLRTEADLVDGADHATILPIAFVRGMKAVYGPRPIEDGVR